MSPFLDHGSHFRVTERVHSWAKAGYSREGDRRTRSTEDQHPFLDLLIKRDGNRADGGLRA